VSAPRLVVVMTVYNEEQYLTETIPAILSQSMPDFGLLLFNNGSTDRTGDMLQTYAEQDRRVVYAAAERNLPPAHTANALMAIAASQWPFARWFLGAGADDVMLPGYLEALCAAIAEHPDANCVFSPWSYIGGVLPDKRFPDYDRATMHAVHQIPAWSAITRELWDAMNGHDVNAGVIGSDWDFFMRASVAGVLRPVQLDRPYLKLRVRQGRKSLSEQSHWPTLHRHLCTVAGQPVPEWAQ